MIEHRDVNSKAFALLLIFALAAVVVYRAWCLPGRAETAAAGSFNVLESEGGRFHSLLPGAGARLAVLGACFVPPRGGPPGEASRVSVGSVRDEGMLKGYSLPPDRLTFTPEGRLVVLPPSPLVQGPRPPQVIAWGNRAKPRIALTFDTGGSGEPGAEAVIDALTMLKVPATFFVCGGFCYANPGLIRALVQRGFEIASHSFSHPWFTRLSGEEIADEIRRTERAVQEVGGANITPYFRPPFGDTDDRVERVVAALGYYTLWWSVDARDWERSTTAEKMAETVLSRASNGDIVIMHTHGWNTARALPAIVNALRARGFELTTVSGILQP